MKSKIFIVLIFFINGLCLAQQNTFNKEAELQKFVERGGKVEETSPNIYNLTYRDGTQRVFNFNKSTNQSSFVEGVETTIINIWEIDTTLYANKFRFWQRVDIVGYFEGTVPIEDINRNGFIELYGVTRYTYPFGGQVDILEQENQGIFHSVYSYDSTSLFVQGIGDIDSDGIKEVHLRTTDTLNGKFYKADSLGALPTTFDFVFYYYPIGQINCMTFGDFDKNNKTDCLFVDWPTVFIGEYNNSINNFNTVFEYSTEGDTPSCLAIGDFDQDRKTELAFGTVLQKAYVIEVVDTNQYSVVWQGFAPTYNAYMVTNSDDIDGNGKPEFWIGGQDFNTGISTFWCYEADGDNNYIPVAGIELRYLLSLSTFYIQSSDTDNDGKEELIINLGNYLLILKFTGKPNNHNYEIFYAKINENTQPGSSFLPSTIYDFNKDGKKDVLLSLDLYDSPNISYILIQDTTTSSVNESYINTVFFDLYQNYPNPFNPSTQLKFILKEQGKVKIAVYDLLGKEIKTLLEENLSTGEYIIHWDGKDSEGNELPGGVYFIRMLAGNYQKTIKSVLLK